MGDDHRSLLADPPERLRPFVREGRIAALPAKWSRRRLLLEQVAQAFEPGLRYPERDVNEILKPFFDDHCALRRYLVDEDLLSRTPGGQYWRSGGPVPVGPGPWNARSLAMRKPRKHQRVASPFTLLIPRDDRGCYPPGPDAADSDCYQSDADLDDGCYGSGSGSGSGEELLRSLIAPRHPRRR